MALVLGGFLQAKTGSSRVPAFAFIPPRSEAKLHLAPEPACAGPSTPCRRGGRFNLPLLCTGNRDALWLSQGFSRHGDCQNSVFYGSRKFFAVYILWNRKAPFE